MAQSDMFATESFSLPSCVVRAGMHWRPESDHLSVYVAFTRVLSPVSDKAEISAGTAASPALRPVVARSPRWAGHPATLESGGSGRSMVAGRADAVDHFSAAFIGSQGDLHPALLRVAAERGDVFRAGNRTVSSAANAISVRMVLAVKEEDRGPRGGASCRDKAPE
jgi:hypothetical protein